MNDGSFELATSGTQTSNSNWVMTAQSDGVEPAAQFQTATWAASSGNKGVWFKGFRGSPGESAWTRSVSQVVTATTSGDYTLTFDAKVEANFASVIGGVSRHDHLRRHGRLADDRAAGAAGVRAPRAFPRRRRRGQQLCDAQVPSRAGHDRISAGAGRRRILACSSMGQFVRQPGDSAGGEPQPAAIASGRQRRANCCCRSRV